MAVATKWWLSAQENNQKADPQAVQETPTLAKAATQHHSMMQAACQLTSSGSTDTPVLPRSPVRPWLQNSPELLWSPPADVGQGQDDPDSTRLPCAPHKGCWQVGHNVFIITTTSTTSHSHSRIELAVQAQQIAIIWRCSSVPMA